VTTEYNDRFFWEEGEIMLSEGEPPTPEEVSHAKKVLKKVVDRYVDNK
jgi:hypothetical protein